MTAEVSLAKELDSNAYSSYELQVSAKDGGKHSLTGYATISLTVHCSPTGQCPRISSDGTVKCMIVYVFEYSLILALRSLKVDHSW